MKIFQINWRPVIMGVFIQVLMGVLVLRWRYGYLAVKFIADEINKFLGYSLEGAAAAFGDPFFMMHPLAFMVIIMFHIKPAFIFLSKTG